MRFRGRRQQVDGWGHGVIVLESMRIRCREGCFFGFFHPETRFQKGAFSGSMWTVGQNNAIHVRFGKREFSCGRPLKLNCKTLESLSNREVHIKRLVGDLLLYKPVETLYKKVPHSPRCTFTLTLTRPTIFLHSAIHTPREQP